jgi:hypothetical protein
VECKPSKGYKGKFGILRGSGIGREYWIEISSLENKGSDQGKK